MIFTRILLFSLQTSYNRASCDNSTARLPRIKSAVHLGISGGAHPPRESLFFLRACRQHNSSLSSFGFDDCTTYYPNIQIHNSSSFLLLCQHQILLNTRIFRVSTPEHPRLSSCNH